MLAVSSQKATSKAMGARLELTRFSDKQVILSSE